MVPSNEILNAFRDLLAADTGTLANAAAMHVHLVAATFTPSPGRVIADFTLATFTGSTPLNAGTGVQQAFLDPLSGRRTIQIKEPAGGWHWQCTAAPGSPETIYGYVVTDNGDTDVYGCSLLPTPVEVSAVGHSVDIPFIRLSYPSDVIS
jgi:hypothetical protein